MTIALLGATGRVGSHLATLLVDAGHRLRLLVRDPSRFADRHSAAAVIIGDARDRAAVGAVLTGADVAVSTLGGTGLEEPGTMLSEAAENLVAAARETGVGRIIWVSASGLLDAPGGGLRNEAPDYPPVFRLISKQHVRVWTTLRTSGLDWTIVCPPHMPTGERTGRYRVEANRLPDGGHQITDADVADFLAREIDEAGFRMLRVGVAY